jgi:trypsin
MRFITLLIVVILFSSAYAEKRSLDIVGGIPANQRQLPFMVSLNLCGGQCGGFLLTATHVGTAAHCFDVNTTASCITAQAGTNDVSLSTNGQIRNVSSFDLHPQYNGTTLLFDAAIITLSSPFIIDNSAVRIAPLETNSSNLPAVNATVYVAGWGDTQTGGPNSPNSLLLVDLPYFDFNNCNTTYNGSLVNAEQICAGGQAGKDSCQGDSGGPLFTTTNIADPIDAKIIGIVSYGDVNCATAGTPGVYSNVPGFANAFFQSIISQSASVAASSVAPSSVAPSSVAPSSVALSSVAPSSVAPSVAASSVAGSSAVVAASSVVASSVAPSAGASSAAASSVARSSVVVAASSGAVAASSGAVAASSGAVAASSGVVAASSGAVASSAAAASKSGSQSGTPSGTPAASSGAVAASSVAKSSGAAASASTSKVIAAKTKTGLAAINCRSACQATFRQCKQTSRRIRTCRRAKKVCVAGCGIVNPRA